jgi:diguanylate cyclase (GGDEF)-like protein
MNSVPTPQVPAPADNHFSRTRSKRAFKRSDIAQLCYAFLIILLGLALMASGRFHRLEYGLLDFYFQHRLSAPVHPSLVMIEIGEDSLQAIGQWPWPAQYHAEMVRILSAWGAQAIVFDDLLPEKDPQAAEDSLQLALRDSGRVYFPARLESRPAKKIWVHSLPVDLEPGGDKKMWMMPPAQYELYLGGIGYLQDFTDKDGMVRSVPTSIAWGREHFYHLGLQSAADFLAEKTHADVSKVVPVGMPRMMIHWTGRSGAFKRYAYADIVRSYQGGRRGLKAAVEPADFKGKICLIGLTAGESVRRYVTPADSKMSRLDVLAEVTNTVLTRKFLRPLSFRQNALLYLLLGLACAILFLNFHNMRSPLTALIFLLGWIAVWYVLLTLTGFWIYAVQPMILVLVLFVFSALYAYLAAVREQSRLFDLATRDGLTGLYVIRYFREVLNQVVEEVLADKTPLAVILTDIDNFKSINDTYGHPAGDLILKKTAHIVQSVVRLKRPAKEMDLVARYGGEEFIVMLRGAPLDQAASRVGERIRVAIEKARYEWDGKLIAVTISVGVSALRSDEKVPDFMVRRADEALYQAKRTGKNRVCQSA